jgi:transcriptional regulator with XRE-family HTH domain
MKINKAVRYYIELCGCSQYKISFITGIDRTTLNRMLQNDNWNPTVSTLGRIAKALNMKVSEIIERAEQPTIKELCSEFGITLGSEE